MGWNIEELILEAYQNYDNNNIFYLYYFKIYWALSFTLFISQNYTVNQADQRVLPYFGNTDISSK